MSELAQSSFKDKFDLRFDKAQQTQDYGRIPEGLFVFYLSGHVSTTHPLSPT